MQTMAARQTLDLQQKNMTNEIPIMLHSRNLTQASMTPAALFSSRSVTMQYKDHCVVAVAWRHGLCCHSAHPQ